MMAEIKLEGIKTAMIRILVFAIIEQHIAVAAELHFALQTAARDHVRPDDRAGIDFPVAPQRQFFRHAMPFSEIFRSRSAGPQRIRYRGIAEPDDHIGPHFHFFRRTESLTVGESLDQHIRIFFSDDLRHPVDEIIVQVGI